MRIRNGAIYISKQDVGENWAFIKLMTDDGLNGYGEISISPKILSFVESICAEKIKKLIGLDLYDFEACNDAVCNRYDVFEWNQNIIFAIAKSGIEQALYDLRAQVSGQPLCEYLGYSRNKLRLYANINRAIRNRYSVQAMISNCKNARTEGFDEVKIAPFEGVSPAMSTKESVSFIKQGIENIRKVSEIGIKVAVDCHKCFNQHSAAVMLDMLESKSATVEYVEDILPYTKENNDFLRKIRKHCRYGFAAGETVTSITALKEILDYADVFSIVNPDVKYVGGIEEALKCIELAKQCGAMPMLHNPTGVVSTAASAHLMMSSSSSVLEYAFGEQVVRNRSLLSAESVSSGFYWIPDQSGLGVCLSNYFLDTCCVCRLVEEQ